MELNWWPIVKLFYNLQGAHWWTKLCLLGLSPGWPSAAGVTVGGTTKVILAIAVSEL